MRLIFRFCLVLFLSTLFCLIFRLYVQTQATTLRLYLTCIRNTLEAAMCLQVFLSLFCCCFFDSISFEGGDFFAVWYIISGTDFIRFCGTFFILRISCLWTSRTRCWTERVACNCFLQVHVISLYVRGKILLYACSFCSIQKCAWWENIH